MLSEHLKNEPSCALKSIERLTSRAIFTSYMYVSCIQIYQVIFHQWRRNRDRERGGVALALYTFFFFAIKICDKSSLHFASDASVHYNPELTPEWFDKYRRNKRSILY